MVDAPEAAAAASSPPDRSSLVERDEKGEIVIPKIEIHSAELANAMRSQRGEFVGGCKLKTETIAVHGDLLQSELQQLQDERKTLKDATELARDRQAELAQLQAKLAQLKATLAEPPPPLASTESLKAELAKQQQKLTKTHGKIEDRKSKLAQRQEEIKQETHKLFKVRQSCSQHAIVSHTRAQLLLNLGFVLCSVCTGAARLCRKSAHAYFDSSPTAAGAAGQHRGHDASRREMRSL